ncbi:hypothetical protein FOA52_007966 [Chlamydomonas sp. UWO 241]|nr:hypothetical protein FOA52_007966 [Chlamydomonas sp. UWO 241]
MPSCVAAKFRTLAQERGLLASGETRTRHNAAAAGANSKLLDSEGSWLELESNRSSVCANDSIGVALSYLEGLAEIAVLLQQPLTTLEWMQIMLPSTAKKGRLLDLIPPRFLGPPAWFISHAWAGSFTGLVDALVRDLAPEPGPTEPPMRPGFKDGLYVAIDLFSPSASASDAPASVCALLGSCPKGLVLVVDAGLASLQRLWCLYEVFWAVQHGKGSAYVRVALPGDTPIEGVVSIQGALTAGLDLAKAECARDKDKSHLLSELRRKSGMQRSNALVTEALGSALFSKLRWRSSVWGWAMYAVLNLRGADHLPLNQLIASVLELDEEEQEMRLLQSYDEKSFIKMLEAGGFSHSEALTKFTDADGHVSQVRVIRFSTLLLAHGWPPAFKWSPLI